MRRAHLSGRSTPISPFTSVTSLRRARRAGAVFGHLPLPRTHVRNRHQRDSPDVTLQVEC